MRARLCIAAGSSTSAAMSSSSRATSPAARGRRPRGRGFCDQPRWRGPRRSGGAFVSGDAHFMTVTEENYERRMGCRGDAGAPGPVPVPPPDPGCRFPQPCPGFRYPPPPSSFHPQPPPFYRAQIPRNSWRPPPSIFGPQRPPSVYGPPPGNSWQAPPWDLCPQPQRPRPQPADYRRWVPSSLPPPPPECQRFRVLSYNILADYLAMDHRLKLYSHIPPESLDWESRKRRLLVEFGWWSPDIMCLQEVDKFQDLEEKLAQYGYSGIWKMRTGTAIDGCAIFWRTHRFVLRHEEHIEFAKFGLRDNVAQICVLEAMRQSPSNSGSAASPARCNPSLRTDRVVVCNIHVLYNPKRGEIKLGQVRVLLDRAYSVSKIWNDAPVIVCGDFNCTPKSPLYSFISEQKLSLSGLARNEVSGQHSACIYPPRPLFGSDLYRGHTPHGNNGGNVASLELDNHQTGIEAHHNSWNNVENELLADRCSSVNVSEKLCSDSLMENEKGAKFDATAVEADGFDHSIMHRENDSSKETVKDSIEPGDAITNMGSEGVGFFISANAYAQEDLHTVVELQHDDKYMKDSVIIETPNKRDGQVNTQHFVLPGNKGMSHDTFDSLSEVKNISIIHTSCTVSTIQEDSIDFELTEDTFSSCNNMLHFEGNKDGFSLASDLENRLDSKSESDKLHDVSLDISTDERISGTFTVDVGTPPPEGIELSTGLLSGQGKADPDVSCPNSYKSEPLDSSNFFDSHLNLEAVDSLVNEVKEEMKNARAGSEQVVTDAYEKLPGDTEDVASQNNAYMRSSAQEWENSDSSSGIDISSSEITSCEEEVNSDSSFLEELRGTGNAHEFSSLSFPDSFTGHSVGEEEVKSDRLNSNMSHRTQESSKIQERIYDPFLWTPMEIEAASGKAECTLLEHNLKLKSAYTEVEDYTGTKGSGREPEVTSYNRQFMGTVDYVWHSEELQTVQVLDTIPKQVLRRTSGFPTKKWGSDHLALACEFAFKKV